MGSVDPKKLLKSKVYFISSKNKTKDWALVQNAALVGVKVNLGYVGLSWLGNLT